jgi:hypothetical protein
MSDKKSGEFLEEFLTESKKYLPRWLYLNLAKAARARATVIVAKATILIC